MIMYRQRLTTLLLKNYPPGRAASQVMIRSLATKRQQRVAAQKAAQKDTTQHKKDSTVQLKKARQSLKQQPQQEPFIKTDLSNHKDYIKSQQWEISPQDQAPPQYPDESGIVSRDLTRSMIELTDVYDKRLHYNPNFDSQKYEASTLLSQEMIQLLAVTNRPMTCADYMRQALTHPLYGYYTNPTSTNEEDNDRDDWADDWDKDDDDNDIVEGSAHDIIGSRGDFVTAPEVSQVFGECLAVWFVSTWESLDKKPAKVRLVEIGPGKGTLMADLLRTSLQSFAYFGNTIHQVHFVEASRAMRRQQEACLQEQLPNTKFVFKHETTIDNDKDDDENDSTATDKDNKNDENAIYVHWHDSFLDFKASTKDETMTTFVICQEFLDALPVHVFEKTVEGWRERLVDVCSDENDNDAAVDSNNNNPEDKMPQLRFVLSPDTTPALRTLLNTKNDKYNVNQVIEVCPEGILLVQDIAKFLCENNGACLVIDYGQEGTGDTLRAFSKHKQVHVLSRPGEVDVTADVDFGALKHAVNTLHKNKDDDAGAAKAFAPVTQGQFLASMGVVERVSQLIDLEETTDQQANDLYMALERLVLPEQMGERYKVLAIVSSSCAKAPPAGFTNL